MLAELEGVTRIVRSDGVVKISSSKRDTAAQKLLVLSLRDGLDGVSVEVDGTGEGNTDSLVQDSFDLFGGGSQEKEQSSQGLARLRLLERGSSGFKALHDICEAESRLDQNVEAFSGEIESTYQGWA